MAHTQGRAFELEGRLATITTAAPAAVTASTTPESGSKGPPPLSAVEKALCHRTLDRYLTRLRGGGGGGCVRSLCDVAVVWDMCMYI